MVKKIILLCLLSCLSVTANAALYSSGYIGEWHETRMITGKYTEIADRHDSGVYPFPGIFDTYGNWGGSGGYVDFTLYSPWMDAAMWVFNSPDRIGITDLVAYESGNMGNLQNGGNITRVSGYTDNALMVVIGPLELTEDTIRAGSDIYNTWMQGYFAGVVDESEPNTTWYYDNFTFTAISPVFFSTNPVLERPEGTQSLQEQAGLYGTDVPEPATAFLALIGAAGFMYRRKQAIK